MFLCSTFTGPVSNSSKLIRSPTFNRAVQKAYRKINRLPDFEQKNGGGSTLCHAFVVLKSSSTKPTARNGPIIIRPFQRRSEEPVSRAHLAKASAKVSTASFCLRFRPLHSTPLNSTKNPPKLGSMFRETWHP